MELKMTINVDLADENIEELAVSLLQAASDVLHEECEVVPDGVEAAEYSDVLHQILNAAYGYVDNADWRLKATATEIID